MKKTQTNKSTHFWVIKNKLTGQFMNKDGRYGYTKNLRNALRILSRSNARDIKSSDESVYKMIQNGNDINLVPEWK